MGAQESKLGALQTDLVTSRSNVQQLQAKLEAADRNLQEREKLLRNNQQVIDFLNNEINESQMGRQASLTGIGETATSLSSPLSFRPSRHSAELLEQQMLSHSRSASHTPSYTHADAVNEAYSASGAAGTSGLGARGSGLADLTNTGLGGASSGGGGGFLPSYRSPKTAGASPARA